MKLDLIYFNDEMLVSKNVVNWTTWQDYFDGYKANLTFEGEAEILEYLKEDYNMKDEDISAIKERNIRLFCSCVYYKF